MIVMLPVSAVLFVEARSGAEIASGYAIAAINKSIAGTVVIGGSSMSLHRIVLRDVALHDYSGATVAVVPKIVAAFELTPLLHRRLVIDELRVVAPSVRMVLSGSGSNVSRALATHRSSHHSLSLALDVREAAVRGGRVLVQRRRRADQEQRLKSAVVARDHHPER